MGDCLDVLNLHQAVPLLSVCHKAGHVSKLVFQSLQNQLIQCNVFFYIVLLFSRPE